MKRVREEIVAKQNACFIVPAGIHRRDVASGFRLVKHIIVDQSRQMNHLDDSRQNLMVVTNTAGRFRGEQQQHRP